MRFGTIFNIFKSFSGQRGFTLPEIMIGGAIVAGVALAGATLFKNQSKEQARIENDQALTQFHHMLSKILENPGHCNATFKSRWGSDVPATGINAVYLCSGNCGFDFTANMVTAGSAFATVGNFVDQARSRQLWLLGSIVPAAALSTTGSLLLKVTYRQNPRLGNRIITKDISVNLRFSNGRFQNCVNNQQSSVNNLQNDLCRSLYSRSSVGAISTTGQIAYFDDVTQRCVINSAIKDCTANGTMLTGMNSSDGAVHCSGFTNSFNTTNPIFDTTPSSSCGSGSQASIQFVGGKFKTFCSPAATTGGTTTGGTTTGGTTTGGTTTGGTTTGGGCFIAGTEIAMANGDIKNIEDIQIGDKLIDVDNKIVTVKTLLPRDYLGEIYSINGGPYFFTPNHPFLSLDGWKSLDPAATKKESPDLTVTKLKIGDVLFKKNGIEAILTLDSKPTREKVYNFELDGSHTYLADDYWVHNKLAAPEACCPSTGLMVSDCGACPPLPDGSPNLCGISQTTFMCAW
jgi:prepilin-type N-terminal cleavage/methylation domain-containing protein